MPSFEFELVPTHGEPSLRQAGFNDLRLAIAKRLPLISLRWQVKIDDELLTRQGGVIAGLEPPVIVVRLTLDLEGDVSQEQARAGLHDVMADMGRPDISVLNA